MDCEDQAVRSDPLGVSRPVQAVSADSFSFRASGLEVNRSLIFCFGIASTLDSTALAAFQVRGEGAILRHGRGPR